MSLIDQWKYEKAYELEPYRMGHARKTEVLNHIQLMIPGSTYLDVGCGRGETLEAAEDCGLIATGTEIVPALIKARDNIVFADIEELPFEDNAFHYVSCNDVLEHLEPGTEQKALDELGRVCSRQLMLTTNDRPSRLPTGEDLHINKRPQHVWNDDIVKRWGGANVRFSRFNNRLDWRWTIRML